MKKFKCAGLLVILMMMGLAAKNTPLYAEEISKAAQKHLEATKSNEDQAAAFDRVIQEHEQMKKDYPKNWTLDPSLVPDPSEVEWMNRHCDDIIRSIQEAKKNVLEMAEWHRQVALHPEQAPKPIHVSEMMLSVSDHAGWMKEYQARADDQDILIAIHEQAKEKYTDPAAKKHCDAIIEDAQKLQASLLDFSKWHRMQTSESERRLAQ